MASQASKPFAPVTKIPAISSDELTDFHQAHFSAGATAQFTDVFVRPAMDAEAEEGNSYYEYTEYDEDDGLGYYDDGVKRTLTDEQIEIFRHSELHELEKAQERALLKKQKRPSEEDVSESDAKETLKAKQSDGSKKKGKRKAKQQLRREPKPDLRKRTWDVVDTGLDSLDYD